MTQVLKMRFLVRSRTKDEWTALNEVLLASTEGTGARELGLEEDTGRCKLGDGETAWNDLPYFTGHLADSADVDGAAPADGDVLTFDAVAGLWKPAAPTGGGEGIASLVPGTNITVDNTDPANPVISAATGSDYAEGSSFPGSPSLNDKFYRADLNLLCYYDGTRWLTVQEYQSPGAPANNIMPVSASANLIRWPVPSAHDILLTAVEATSWVAAPNNGSSYWTVGLSKTAVNGTDTALSGGSFTTGSAPDAATTYCKHDLALGEVVSASTHPAVTLACTKSGSAGALYVQASLKYRRIVT